MHKVIIIIFALILMGCNKKEKLSKAYLDKAKPILKDMYVAEAALSKAHISIRDSLTNVYKSQILEIHEITEEELDKLIAKLKSDPKSYAEINKSVADEFVVKKKK